MLLLDVEAEAVLLSEVEADDVELVDELLLPQAAKEIAMAPAIASAKVLRIFISLSSF